ncbi:xanthine dehydrogenase family protein molybdopterin-binding subunit [Mycolicibacterium smegmatis]|uniref:Aldehyde oxidase and xanthine dehydrogenase molybdopterin binding protein n=3 Tax=Mycolicibacterium smegmatis TaxID=1772 RepID=I7FWT1_MYCS2|nr:xanthine dehydrogenase family protein molybdopterin-binding subunit [Mycolicibacterium smegmatis]ABK70154.1 aldehyde oxidase and xanthine dehydrogenase, molybdopterin binding [Mycolicibacterium smegmatis MC2 155]AFP37147.1 Aldehyde oxidase and xanthine dehydrogenase molybdopterin binding protein [Mycolicibacterium smegmatis MC2 155]MBE9617999.1 xanthine dehydrogenase family protein molybdopterin-binding subunit [Mycolicibacterium smegmatis]MBE9624411.1 xanthine dehydrogenase family protein m
MTLREPRAIGQPVIRKESRAKVTGAAPYAFEHIVDNALYLHPVQATIARGRVVAMDVAAARALDGVRGILTVFDAPELADTSDGEFAILQDDRVHFRGQIIGGVLAESAETAREAAALVRVEYLQEPHDTELRADHPGLYTPDEVNGGEEPDTDDGDVEAALAQAAVTVDETYETPIEHNNPMEPHACIAQWNLGDSGKPAVVLYDSTQGVHAVRKALAPIFGLEPEQIRVIAPHVGGGFGSKGAPHAHNVLAILAAQRSNGRPVKLALTRQQMFSLVGYRTPTIQRIRLGADHDGRITALVHDVVEQTSAVKEFAEQTAITSRKMYSAASRRTTHKLAALDVAIPFWMRAPGECPGTYAAEVAMDELAVACGLDPIELRVRNDPEVDPETGKPWSGRHLVDCLRLGADRFGWAARDPRPAARRDGEWLIGTGVAAATYPGKAMPGNSARITYAAEGRYTVQIGAADIGTGTWTTLSQIAADALACDLAAVDLQIGDTDLPEASVAGGSSGITSWGSAIVAAARQFRADHGDPPAVGATTVAQSPENPDADGVTMQSFGAHFVEAHVNADTGEIRVPRMLGVFSVGRVINARTLRSQLIGGMTMGLSMALHEESVRDPRFGHVVTQDLATYHISAHADVADIDAIWLDEADEYLNPMGSRGAGEIGIVGSASAVVNAVYHATGVRVRNLPVTVDKVLAGLPKLV